MSSEKKLPKQNQRCTISKKFLLNISGVVTFEEIPDALIINWDQTGINYVPVSQWTMAKEGLKRVEVAGVDDKRQITAMFAGSLSGDFLPPQIVYQGKTVKCLPSVEFPKSWDITCTPNHWCNEKTTIRYIQNILIPYLQTKRQELSLPETFPALMIFDEFTGQTTDQVLEFLEKNNLYYVIVPPSCTDKLQPLDLSVNKCVKEFLWARFQEWYSENIGNQLKDTTNSVHPVDLKLSVMKLLGAKWLIQLEEYLKVYKARNNYKWFQCSGIKDISLRITVILFHL